MQYKAEARQVNISPRKVRLVVDAVKHLTVTDALTELAFVRKRASYPLKKLLESAIANAVHNGKAERGTLTIKAIDVTDGPAYKRYRPSTRGRIHPYKKRTSHIRIILTDDKKQVSNIKEQKSVSVESEKKQK